MVGCTLTFKTGPAAFGFFFIFIIKWRKTGFLTEEWAEFAEKATEFMNFSHYYALCIHVITNINHGALALISEK